MRDWTLHFFKEQRGEAQVVNELIQENCQDEQIVVLSFTLLFKIWLESFSLFQSDPASTGPQTLERLECLGGTASVVRCSVCELALKCSLQLVNTFVWIF